MIREVLLQLGGGKGEEKRNLHHRPASCRRNLKVSKAGKAGSAGKKEQESWKSNHETVTGAATLRLLLDLKAADRGGKRNHLLQAEKEEGEGAAMPGSLEKKGNSAHPRQGGPDLILLRRERRAKQTRLKLKNLKKRRAKEEHLRPKKYYTPP